MASRLRDMRDPLSLMNGGTGTGIPKEWPGGEGVFMARSNGGTVTLQYKLPGSPDVWVPVGDDTTLSANGGGFFVMPPEVLLRVVSTGSATYATARQVD